MNYNFEIKYSEDNMQNYFRGVSGRHIKDTLIITLRNTGTKPWGKYKGYFKCVEEKSNYFFETIQIPEDIYPSNSLELVLNYPRIEKNNHQGDCFSTIQLVYKDQPYNSQVIRFRKDYDLLGNEINDEGKIDIKEEKPKEIFEPHEKNNKEDDNIIIVKKFRSAFDFSKADFSDEYLLELLKLSKNDFQSAMMIHLDKEDQKKEDIKNKAKTSQGLDELVQMFRKQYQLGKEDYPDDKLKQVLAKKQGNFENAFEELMSFIE